MRLIDIVPWRWRHPIKALRMGLFRLPGRCHCCGRFTLCHPNERPAYSAVDGAWLCDPCKEQNDLETELAWADYYAGRL